MPNRLLSRGTEHGHKHTRAITSAGVICVYLTNVTDQQLQELSVEDCTKALSLLVKLSQNLYMEFTLNYKKAALMSVDVIFAHGLRDGYRMWLSVMSTPPGYQGSAVRGSDLVELIDAERKQRNVGLLLEEISIMKAAMEHPLEDLPNVEAPSSGTIKNHLEAEEQLEREAEALSDQLDQYLFRRMEVFGGPFQLADEARIDSLPLHECESTLQLFMKFAQNLREELAVCAKHERVRERDLQFMTAEKTLYENAFRDLLDKLEPQG
ncbi:hypothetical protein AAVH_21809 [Aphelenchoides avenae]|nr:hypothetical protein AAVH_21809 [Aphelenchus avenae]